MSAVDVRVHRREPVSETLGHKALRGQVIALVEIKPTENAKKAGITFEAG